jgi:deazaflavin-dependent oxidoreductase (nitroreductase family)
MAPPGCWPQGTPVVPDRTSRSRGANRFVEFALRSRLLGWTLRGTTMLITVTGRKTGRTYTTPVNYVRRGQDLYLISRPERTWWRNLRSAAPVSVFLAGRELPACATVVDSATPAVQEAAEHTRLATVIAAHPDWPVIHVSLER